MREPWLCCWAAFRFLPFAFCFPQSAQVIDWPWLVCIASLQYPPPKPTKTTPKKIRCLSCSERANLSQKVRSALRALIEPFGSGVRSATTQTKRYDTKRNETKRLLRNNRFFRAINQMLHNTRAQHFVCSSRARLSPKLSAGQSCLRRPPAVTPVPRARRPAVALAAAADDTPSRARRVPRNAGSGSLPHWLIARATSARSCVHLRRAA